MLTPLPYDCLDATPWYWGSCFIKEGTKVTHVNIVLAAAPTEPGLPAPQAG